MKVGCVLAGCKVGFLVIKKAPSIDNKSIVAMDVLKNSGVRHVKTIRGFDEAAKLYAKIQKSPTAVKTNVFFKLDSWDTIVPVFGQVQTL
ncbi:MAG: hypothetical protein Q8O93_01545 [bacterium]|nr:hypothetical protein [bacterium]